MTLREDLKGGKHGTLPGQRAFLALGGGAPWAWVSACSFIASGGTGAITFLDHKTLNPRLIINDIEKSAKLTVIENRREGARLGKC